MSGTKETVTRRDFLRIILTGVGACYAAAIGYPLWRYLISPAEQAKSLAAVKEVTLKDAHTLAAGSVLMFKFGSHPAMLIHHKDGSWVALDAVCTHLGCTVQYQPDRNVIHCNCHGGEYDAQTGKNISGPPPRPLRPYVVKVIEGGVLVSRV
ncbi:MAG: Rieske (2Fe-2S) protein [Candidatus Omnitrophica bacterium]|nr:Rieske (2Fe-2S) protein [Candidatus Omnitrophota bacterium]